MSDNGRPWRIGGNYGRKFGDRWPATFVNARHAGTYGQGGGLVLDPSIAKIHCGYARDGRSMDKGCSGHGATCVPGCTPWCAERDVGSSSECAWKPERLDALARQQDATNPWGHNEIVLSPPSVERGLPHSVLAVFYQDQSSEEEKRRCAAVHRTFLRDYPHMSTRTFPLLVFHHPQRRYEPPHFTCAECGSEEHEG